MIARVQILLEAVGSIELGDYTVSLFKSDRSLLDRASVGEII